MLEGSFGCELAIGLSMFVTKRPIMSGKSATGSLLGRIRKVGFDFTPAILMLMIEMQRH